MVARDLVEPWTLDRKVFNPEAPRTRNPYEPTTLNSERRKKVVAFILSSGSGRICSAQVQVPSYRAFRLQGPGFRAQVSGSIRLSGGLGFLRLCCIVAG